MRGSRVDFGRKLKWRTKRTGKRSVAHSADGKAGDSAGIHRRPSPSRCRRATWTWPTQQSAKHPTDPAVDQRRTELPPLSFSLLAALHTSCIHGQWGNERKRRTDIQRLGADALKIACTVRASRASHAELLFTNPRSSGSKPASSTIRPLSSSIYFSLLSLISPSFWFSLGPRTRTGLNLVSFLFRPPRHHFRQTHTLSLSLSLFPRLSVPVSTRRHHLRGKDCGCQRPGLPRLSAEVGGGWCIHPTRKHSWRGNGQSAKDSGLFCQRDPIPVPSQRVTTKSVSRVESMMPDRKRPECDSLGGELCPSPIGGAIGSSKFLGDRKWIR